MELIFLGTGAGQPSGRRNVSSLVLNLSAEAGEYWLFDCGEGTQHQMMRTAVTPHRIKQVFITHLHGDHIYGLPGLLTSRSMTKGAPALDVYGPAGIKRFLETSLQVSQSYMTFDLRIHEIGAGLIIEDERIKVFASELKHRIPTFGFRIEEADKLGRLNIEALRALGLPKGELLSKLKKGEQVLLEDGRRIDGRDFLGPSVAGKVVAILGDTMPCVNAHELAYQADVLVHEATQGAALWELANSRGHSTTIQAAQVAKESEAKQLIITHISQRYGREQETRMLEECRAVFPATMMAYDLSTFMVE